MEGESISGLVWEVTEPSTTSRLVHVRIAAETYEAALRRELGRIRRSARIAGFRPGKAPVALIEQRHGTEAADRARRDLLTRAGVEILKRSGLAPIGPPPQWTRVRGDRGEPLQAELGFEVLPRIGTVDFAGIEVTRTKTAVTEEQIGEALDAIRRERATPGPIGDRGLEDGDFVIGNLTETADNGEEPRVTEGVQLQVGSGAYHPALHEALQGAAVGDTVIASATFGNASPDRERAGRTLRVQFEVRRTAAPILPPLDDELARSVGANSLLALRGDVRDRLRLRARSLDASNLESALLHALVAKNPVEAPEALVAHEVELRLRRAASELGQNAGEVDWDATAKSMRESADGSVRAMLLLDALAAQESVEAAPEAIEERLENLAEATKRTVAAVRAHLEKTGEMRSLVNGARRAATLQLLEDRSRVNPAPEDS